jgi:hypothetical protein
MIFGLVVAEVLPDGDGEADGLQFSLVPRRPVSLPVVAAEARHVAFLRVAAEWHERDNTLACDVFRVSDDPICGWELKVFEKIQQQHRVNRSPGQDQGSPCDVCVNQDEVWVHAAAPAEVRSIHVDTDSDWRLRGQEIPAKPAAKFNDAVAICGGRCDASAEVVLWWYKYHEI